MDCINLEIVMGMETINMRSLTLPLRKNAKTRDLQRMIAANSCDHVRFTTMANPRDAVGLEAKKRMIYSGLHHLTPSDLYKLHGDNG